MGLGADGVDLHRRDIVIVLDAPEALGRYARLALTGAPQARLYGLLDRSRRLAPYDGDRVLALFGLDEVVIPRHGCVERPVEVVTVRVTGGPAVAPGDDVVALKRRAVWLNPVRNRRLARLAGALAQGDLGRVAAESPALAARLGDGAESRVVVLVENVEHALALAERLPGWPIVTGPDVVTVGLSAQPGRGPGAVPLGRRGATGPHGRDPRGAGRRRAGRARRRDPGRRGRGRPGGPGGSSVLRVITGPAPPAGRPRRPPPPGAAPVGP